MSNEKLSELSKPAWIVGEKEIADFMRGDEALLVRGHDPDSTEPALRMYSQEYVSALLTALRNIYAACDTGERRGDGSQQGVAMPDWGTVDSVRALLESINNG